MLSSGVEFQFIDGITELVNSEGTELRYHDTVNWLMAKAEGQAPDGMLLRDAVSIQSIDLDKLPSDAEMRKSLADMGEHVRALVKAPMGEGYSGPTLFKPQAAGSSWRNWWATTCAFRANPCQTPAARSISIPENSRPRSAPAYCRTGWMSPIIRWNLPGMASR